MMIKKMRVLVCPSTNHYEKLTEKEMFKLCSEIKKGILEIGVESTVEIVNSSSMKVVGCRLTDEYTREYGLNASVNPFNNDISKHGSILGFLDWVEVLVVMNTILDANKISANISSSGIDYLLRDEMDWSIEEIKECRYDNVGSQRYPLHREDQWSSLGRGRIGWNYDRKWRRNIAEWLATIEKIIKSGYTLNDTYLETPLFMQYKDEIIKICMKYNNFASGIAMQEIQNRETISLGKVKQRKGLNILI